MMRGTNEMNEGEMDVREFGNMKLLSFYLLLNNSFS